MCHKTFSLQDPVTINSAFHAPLPQFESQPKQQRYVGDRRPANMLLAQLHLPLYGAPSYVGFLSSSPRVKHSNSSFNIRNKTHMYMHTGSVPATLITSQPPSPRSGAAQHECINQSQGCLYMCNIEDLNNTWTPGHPDDGVGKVQWHLTAIGS